MRCRVILRRLLIDRRAATAVEYGLICAILVLGTLVAVRGLATGVIGMWSNVNTSVSEAQ